MLPVDVNPFSFCPTTKCAIVSSSYCLIARFTSSSELKTTSLPAYSAIVIYRAKFPNDDEIINEEFPQNVWRIQLSENLKWIFCKDGDFDSLSRSLERWTFRYVHTELACVSRSGHETTIQYDKLKIANCVIFTKIKIDSPQNRINNLTKIKQK